MNSLKMPMDAGEKMEIVSQVQSSQGLIINAPEKTAGRPQCIVEPLLTLSSTPNPYD